MILDVILGVILITFAFMINAISNVGNKEDKK